MLVRRSHYILRDAGRKACPWLHRHAGDTERFLSTDSCQAFTYPAALRAPVALARGGGTANGRPRPRRATMQLQLAQWIAKGAARMVADFAGS